MPAMVRFERQIQGIGTGFILLGLASLNCTWVKKRLGICSSKEQGCGGTTACRIW